MAMFKDDSADDVTCCYLQLEERLRINRGERPSSSRYAMSGKDMKQLCNQQRQKHILDEQSSSSSSLDMHNDPCIPGPSSAFTLHNKKRQNGDKPVDRCVNPKRTCLEDDLFQTSQQWSDCRKAKKNGDIPYSKRVMDFTAEPPSLSARSLLPGNTYEDHANDLSDFSDLDGWSKFDKNPTANNAVPKHPGLFEIPSSGSRGVQFVDSTSEDDSRTRQIGALKGGRQSPDPTSNKIMLRRKIKRVLESDDSDSDEWQVGYRTRPVMFSSSDSDDSRASKRPKDKPSGIVSKKSANLSFSSGDSQKSGQDHSYYGGRTGKSIYGAAAGPSGPPRSDYRTRSPSYKSYKTRGSNRLNGLTAHTIEEGLTISEREMLQPSVPHRRTLRSSQDAGVNPTSRVRARIISDFELDDPIGNGDVASSSRVPPEFLPSFSHQGHSRMSPQSKLTRGSSSRKLPDSTTRRRALGRSRPLKEKPNLAALHPDIFDAEDSSEVEFFTANSYSDNESNTESLNRRMGPLNGRPVSKPQVRSDPSINVGSSEDEISVVFSSGPQSRSPHSRTGEVRRRPSRTLGRRYSRGSRRSLPLPQDVSLSPDPVEQVRQVEEDERFARTLQAQFDAEVDPTYRPHGSPNPCQMNIREGTSSDDDASSREVEEMMVLAASANRVQLPFSFPVTPNFQTFGTLSHPEANMPRWEQLARRSNAARRFDVRINLNSALPGSGRMRTRLPGYETHAQAMMAPWIDRFPMVDDSYETFIGLIEMNGDVTRGMQKSQINRLPTRKYATINSASSSGVTELPHKRAELNKECQVCLNDYVDGDVLRILPCFHEFHTPCIDPWLKINHTCPVCRVVVDVDD